MMIDNVVFDIDGTLTDRATGLISDATYDAIKQLQKIGLRIIIATGRPFFEVNKNMLKRINPSAIILNNGRIVMDQAYEVLYDEPIPETTTSVLLDYIKTKQWDCAVHLKEYTAVLKGESIQNVISGITFNISKIKVNQKLLNSESIYNIMVKIETKEELENLRLTFPDLNVESFFENFYDIYPKGCDKSTGIELILKKIRSNWSRTLVFGDGLNDRQMLTKAGFSYVMMDGHDDLKKIKGIEITKNANQNGIVIALLKLGLVEHKDHRHGWVRFKHRFTCTSLRYTFPISIFLFIAVLYDLIRQSINNQTYMYIFLSIAFLIYSITFYCKEVE